MNSELTKEQKLMILVLAGTLTPGQLQSILTKEQNDDECKKL